MLCDRCKKRLDAGEGYGVKGRTFCEICCMEIRSPRARRTHWQYLRSIKTQYLMESQKALNLEICP